MTRLVVVVVIDTVVWAVAGVVVGRWAAGLALDRLHHDGPVTRLRAAERGGTCYERVGIRRWKDRLPEAGTLFGGTSKAHLAGRDDADLARYAAETRRAERVHWVLLALGPGFALWNPLPLAAAMVAYGVIANVPCLVVQRYNRGRIVRILDRRTRRRRSS